MFDKASKSKQEQPETDRFGERIQAVYRFLYRLVTDIGFEELKILKRIYDAERKLSLRVEKRLTPLLTRLIKCLTGGAQAAFRAIKHPFSAVAKGVRLLRRNVSEAKKGKRKICARRNFFYSTAGIAEQ